MSCRCLGEFNSGKVKQRRINRGISMEQKNIGFIGAGNMAFSLIGGLINNGYESKKIWISDADAQRRREVVQQLQVNQVVDNPSLIDLVDIVILAVKPQIMQTICLEIKKNVNINKVLIISVAAGISTDMLQQWLAVDKKKAERAIIRCMPNTPALVQTGITALYAGAGVSATQKMQAEMILRAAGTVVWLEDEQQMHAVTAISGSGPAYYFYFIEIMEQAAKQLGLPDAVARLLALETAFGASKMALESEEPAELLRARVTSPGGTTEKAIQYMQQHNLEDLLTEAVKQACERSKQLSQMLKN